MLRKFFLLIFLLFFNIISFFNSVNAQQDLIEIRMNEIYKENKNLIDSTFGEDKSHFENHFKKNYKITVNDYSDKSTYLRKLNEFIVDYKNEKKSLEKESSSGSNGQINEGLEKFRHIIVDEDSNFILNALFGTSDYNKLVKSGLLPIKGENPKTYNFMMSMYGYLFGFFVIVGSVIIFIFIFFIIANHKGVLGKNKDSGKYKKFEDFFIGFIIIVIVLFGGLRLYISILTSGMKSFEEDLHSIGITEYNVRDLNSDISDINN